MNTTRKFDEIEKKRKKRINSNLKLNDILRIFRFTMAYGKREALLRK